MKPTYADFTHEGTLSDVTRTRMGVDADAMAHIMAILTDLYSDPELAVIREYSLNALDSHRAAGNADPVEVTLPTALSPVYRVVDRGLGLSVDDVVGHLSKYGWSSKRETNDVTGMLGLGFKSGLTYTSQFTVIVRKQGVEASVLVTRDNDGAGAVQVIDTRSTDLPDGVEVSVPVRDVDRFNERAEFFFRFWEPGEVLVNDETPESFWHIEDGLVLDPDVLVTTELDEDYVVMGNVAYPCGERISKSYYYHVVCRVEIGTVDFVPSREALQYTPRTEGVVTEARDFVQQRILGVAQASVDAAETPSEALLRAKEWYAALPKYRFTYWGNVIPRQIPGPMSVWTPATSWRYNSRTGTNDHAAKKHHACTVDTALESLHVVGLKTTGVSTAIKQATRQYIQAHGIDTNQVIFAPEALGQPWFDGLVTPVDIEAIKCLIPRAEKAPRPERPRNAFKVLRRSGYVSYETDLPEGTCVWVGTTEFADRETLATALTDASIILVNAKQEEKFAQTHTDIPHIKAYVAQTVQTEAQKFTESDVSVMEHEDAWSDLSLDDLDPDEVIDPGLSHLLKLFSVDSSALHSQWNGLVRLTRMFGLDEPTLPEANGIIPRQLHALREKYPLASQLRYPSREQITDYVNAIHAYKKGN